MLSCSSFVVAWRLSLTLQNGCFCKVVMIFLRILWHPKLFVLSCFFSCRAVARPTKIGDAFLDTNGGLQSICVGSDQSSNQGTKRWWRTAQVVLQTKAHICLGLPVLQWVSCIFIDSEEKQCVWTKWIGDENKWWVSDNHQAQKLWCSEGDEQVLCGERTLHACNIELLWHHYEGEWQERCSVNANGAWKGSGLWDNHTATTWSISTNRKGILDHIWWLDDCAWWIPRRASRMRTVLSSRKRWCGVCACAQSTRELLRGIRSWTMGVGWCDQKTCRKMVAVTFWMAAKKGGAGASSGHGMDMKTEIVQLHAISELGRNNLHVWIGDMLLCPFQPTSVLIRREMVEFKF